MWIETFNSTLIHDDNVSHPAWVCGLKLGFSLPNPTPFGHTLRGCVDWNTMFSNDGPIKEPSHPAWVCGLKPQKKQRCNSTRCHTLRGCVDWNSLYLLYIHEEVVTPCVGVWIETTGIPVFWNSVWSHPAWVCGLKPLCNFVFFRPYYVTPCVGVWIETISRIVILLVKGHTLRGCVDWNMASSSGVSKSPGVTPCVGVWIETATGLVTVNQGGVTPCVGVWIETSTNILIGDLAKVTPCVGVWIETAFGGLLTLGFMVTPCVGVWIETRMMLSKG